MDDLIEALQIFRQYGNPAYPTHCEHDELMVMVDPKLVSPEDATKLGKLGFTADSDGEYFISFKFGSA